MTTFFLKLNSVGRPKSGFFRYVARPCVLFTDGYILSCQYPDSCSCLAGLTTIPRDLIFTTRANIRLYNRSSSSVKPGIYQTLDPKRFIVLRLLDKEPAQ